MSNLPTYFLKGDGLLRLKAPCRIFSLIFSLFPLPTVVAKRIERIYQNFLSGGNGEEKKFHLASWNKVYQPVSCGGLGLQNLILFNKTILGKWLWRHQLERNTLWMYVVEVKYGSVQGRWYTNEFRGMYKVNLWKTIQLGWGTFLILSNKVGDGNRIIFWHDYWCG